MCDKCFIESSTCLFSQRRIRTTGSDDCDFDTLLEPSCQCKRGFIDRNGQPCSFTQSNDCVTLMKVRNSLTKFNCFIDIEQMMSVLEKANDLFCGESPAQSKYQIVVRKLSLNFTVSDSHFFLKRINVCNFGFDEVHSPVQHGMSQVK